MSGPSHSQRPASRYAGYFSLDRSFPPRLDTFSSHPQSVYSGSANTAGRPRDSPTYQARYTTYSSTSDPIERFWVTGQGTHRTRHAADELAKFDQRWCSATR
ncbi:hypothetical protein LX36DRAFT_653420 [Colletotrichum falcatum]|nr:hypothetical protein LX36DRAFT_653420 [Colletotrichum falcatum]